MICHSESAIDLASQDVIKTTRWNKMRDAIYEVSLLGHSLHAGGFQHQPPGPAIMQGRHSFMSVMSTAATRQEHRRLWGTKHEVY
jgi:hypothetical protein